jgi:predicted ATPase
MTSARPLPAGTLTMLLTDVEGSTILWTQRPDAMRSAMERHHAIANEVIARLGGYTPPDQGEGDSLFAVFTRASDAVTCALDLQRRFSTERWPEGADLRVRVAVHTGELELRDDRRNYFGVAISHCARLRSAGHGGQVLLSETTHSVVGAMLPAGATVRDLGVHRFKDLSSAARVFQLIHPDVPSEFPLLHSLDARRHNLPAQVTSFIGRELEMEDVKRLLTERRLVTLVGVGGTGKTRLAIQVAADLLDRFGGGVWLVELASVADEALVPHAVAAAVGLRERPEESIQTTLALALGAQQMLLVFDNCEHLIDACARLADQLLRQCSNVRILATSREPLRIEGEVTWAVSSLTVPPTDQSVPFDRLVQYESIRMFADRAGAASPKFSLSREVAPAVAEICARLDGIPLALELAAVRVKALSVHQIAARLNDRFRLLTAGRRVGDERHQTLRALVDWSYDLLSEPERRLFNRLTVFVGGFGVESAEAVCAGEGLEDHAVLDLLGQLMDKSLVAADEERGGEARYRLLETLQQYGAEKLQDTGEDWLLRRRHTAWCLDLAERAESEVGQAEGSAWAARLQTERDNLRAALDRSKLDDAPETTLRLAGALWWFWETKGYWTEGRRQLDAVLATTGDAPVPLRLKVIHGAATLADSQGDRPRATTLLEQAVRLHRELGDHMGLAFTLNRLGQIAFREGNVERASVYLDESLALFRTLGDPVLIADALETLGMVAHHRGDAERATVLLQEGLELFRGLGDKRGMASALRGLADLAQDRADYARAGALAEESAALFRDIGDVYGLGSVLYIMANAAVGRGDYERAEQLMTYSLGEKRKAGDKEAVADSLRDLAVIVQGRNDYARALSFWKESLILHRELGNAPRTVDCLEGLAGLAGQAGQPERAARLFGAATALRAAVGGSRWRGLFRRTESDHHVRITIGEEGFAAAAAAGGTLSLEQAVEEALAVEFSGAEEERGHGNQ